MNLRRVVITGMGAVTSSGAGTDALWDAAVNARHGFFPISGFDTQGFDVRYAAEIQWWDPVAQGLNKKDARRMDLFSQYAAVTAKLAIEDSAGFARGLDPYRIGVLVATGVGGFKTFEDEHQKFVEKGPGRVSVFFIPMMIGNMAGGQIAIDYGFKGDNFCAVSACASSANAVGEAFRKIRHGSLDACVAGGSEASITKFSLAGFHNMGALAVGEDPARLSIPFDAERGGFVMGEGAGILILEELEHAKKRGAKIYAEITGYGATNDAYHITAPDPNGEGGAMAMRLALEEAGISPGQVDYINAHGTGTDQNDRIETAAIKTVFGEHAYRLAVSSTKGVTGHLLGAAGAVESIICAKALHEGVLPPTAGYKVPDEACDLDYITGGARNQEIDYAISNSLGFGGHNATLAFARYRG